MKVDASRIQPSGWEKADGNRLTAKETRRPEQQAATEPVTSSAEPQAEQVAREQAQAKGVMRLLQEGHFKGVAELRLRINFFEQLSALEQGQQQEAARAGVTELAEAMAEKIAALAESGLIDAERLAQFDELATGFIGELQQSGTGDLVDGQDALAGLQQSFDGFDAALRQLLLDSQQISPLAAEPAPPATVEPSPAPPGPLDEGISPAAVEGDVSETAASDAAPSLTAQIDGQAELLAGIDALAATFGNQLQAMEERLTAASLPAVTEPADNQGGAYQKFLAIYRQMQGLGPAEAETSPTT